LASAGAAESASATVKTYRNIEAPRQEWATLAVSMWRFKALPLLHRHHDGLDTPIGGLD
jgi:hypothetical protein